MTALVVILDYHLRGNDVWNIPAWRIKRGTLASLTPEAKVTSDISIRPYELAAIPSLQQL